MILTKRNHSPSPIQWRWALILLFLIAPLAYASSGGGEIAMNFLWIAVLLLLAKAGETWGGSGVGRACAGKTGGITPFFK